jgi:hypothetical protein
MYNPDMTAEFSDAQRGAAERLADDLARVFADRLLVVVAYKPGSSASGDQTVHTLALADRITANDLSALLTIVPAWHKAKLATPLLLGRDEFERTLDVFPIEYQAILSDHVILRGNWPAALHVRPDDLRRACERQIKGHLIHLREGFLETHGRPSAVAELLRASVAPFRSALRHIASLEGLPSASDADLATFAGSIGADATAVREVLAGGAAGADASALLSRYIAATEQLWRAVDRR